MYISMEERRVVNNSLKPLPVAKWSTKTYSPNLNKSEDIHSPPDIS